MRGPGLGQFGPAVQLGQWAKALGEPVGFLLFCFLFFTLYLFFFSVLFLVSLSFSFYLILK